MRDHMIKIEKLQELKPEATHRIEHLVEDILSKTKQIYRNHVERTKMENYLEEYNETEDDLMKSIDEKFR